MTSVDGGPGCAATITTATTIVGGDSATQTVGPDVPLVLQEWRIQIQWASTDLSLFASASTTSNHGSSEDTPKPSGSASQPNDEEHSGLSIAAKAGIGVGVGVVCVLLALAIVFFLRKRKQQQRRLANPRSNEPQVQHLQSSPVYEADTQARRPELEAKATRAELEGT